MRELEDNFLLRKPGWLPTAIVVNILLQSDKRRGKVVPKSSLVHIEEVDGSCSIIIPNSPETSTEQLAPLEVIDGQHRLWAFDASEHEHAIPDDFELPVVAYLGLDVAWQAYLFWSINVSPKRINPSHAFDLYPLLRTQDWLANVGEITVYREARAQELTEIAFTHRLSPWHGRINMLGEKGKAGASQAAWVRGLLASYLGTGRGRSASGLYQVALIDDAPLDWSRAQQAAFLILLWREIRAEIEARSKQYFWMRQYQSDSARALTDKTSMLNQDQGLRAVLAVSNDIFVSKAEEWQLDRWYVSSPGVEQTSESDVEEALHDLERTSFARRLKEVAAGIASFDWRSLDGPNVQGEEAIVKRSYRGSGGYAAMRRDLLAEVAKGDTAVAAAANRVLQVESADDGLF